MASAGFLKYIMYTGRSLYTKVDYNNSDMWLALPDMLETPFQAPKKELRHKHLHTFKMLEAQTFLDSFLILKFCFSILLY